MESVHTSRTKIDHCIESVNGDSYNFMIRILNAEYKYATAAVRESSKPVGKRIAARPPDPPRRRNAPP